MTAALELAGLVDEWWLARMTDMAEAGVLDVSAVTVSTQTGSYPPSAPARGRVARHLTPPDAGPAA